MLKIIIINLGGRAIKIPMEGDNRQEMIEIPKEKGSLILVDSIVMLLILTISSLSFLPEAVGSQILPVDLMTLADLHRPEMDINDKKNAMLASEKFIQGQKTLILLMENKFVSSVSVICKIKKVLLQLELLEN